MTDISKKALDKIKKEQMHPRPRWYFLTRNFFFWLMFGLTTFLGSIAFGMIMLITMELDWDIYPYLGLSLLETILISLPYLWIVLLAVFLFITYYNFIHTRTGYRYRFVVIFFISLLLSALLGFGLYQYGWTDTVEEQLSKRIPVYHNLIYTCENQWMHPEKGLLGGTIVKINTEKGVLYLVDYHNQEWQIEFGKAFIRGNIALSRNQKIKIIGRQLSANHFQAVEIRISRGRRQGTARGQN